MTKREDDSKSLGHQCPLLRREFIVAAGGAVASLSAASMLGCERFLPEDLGALGPGPHAIPVDLENLRFADRYRTKWSWDTVVRGSHNLNCGAMNCVFDIYVRDGVVVREEQAAPYSQKLPGLVDANPRGCQKGCSYSELMYSPARLRTPLRRKGARGSGSWEEISWEQAALEIADRLIDAISEDGPDSVVIDTGTNIGSQTTMASVLRFADVIDAVLLDVNAELGDDQHGAAVTYGDLTGANSGDDYLNSDLILIWGGNPAYTQIANYHFLTEARYNGATLISICPDLNASAIHADEWISVKPGTDAALALSIAKVVIDEGLYDATLIREQTDLPCLVRLDTQKLLRESDLRADGSDRTLYQFDLEEGVTGPVDVETLSLGDRRPALEGTFEVETLDGPVAVQPVFEQLKTKLEDFTPERTSERCGVSPDTIRRLAHRLAKARAATNVYTTGMSKYYHGDAIMRAQILVFVLCGHLGKKGAGFQPVGLWFTDGAFSILKDSQAVRELRWPLAKKFGPRVLWDLVTGKDMHRTLSDVMGDAWVRARLATSSTLFWNIHGGILKESEDQNWDPALRRRLREYVDEALENEWQLLEPAPDKKPRVLFSMAGNLLRRVRSADELEKVLWPKLDLIVDLDVRMSSTARMADYVLPVAGAYEKSSAMIAAGMVAPVLGTTNAAVPPVGDSKDEWEIVCILTEAIQRRARERGVRTFTSRRGHSRRLDRVHDVLTRNGDLGAKDGEKLSELMLEATNTLGGTSWPKMKKQGFAPITGVGKTPLNWGYSTDFPQDDTVTAFRWHTEKKKPWPTLSGRVQFYIDHDWYLELGEELPAHKPPIKAGGDYPLTMTGGHNRWSIHAMWRSDPLLLRLQRGEPVMWVSVENAEARRIVDGDQVEVFNDLGQFRIQVKVSAAVQPGQVIVYHAWENYQFEGGMGYRNLTPSPINPIRLVGDYPNMKPSFATRQPHGNDRDTRVDLRRV